MAVLRQVRGRLVRRPPGGGVEVVADGRGDWVGWVDLTTEPVTAAAIANTARVIRDLNPAGARRRRGREPGRAQALHRRPAPHRPRRDDPALPLFPHVMLIDGNDDRGIDVALLTQAGYPLGTIRSHVDDTDDQGRRVLPRLPRVRGAHPRRAPARRPGQPPQVQGLRLAGREQRPAAPPGPAGRGHLPAAPRRTASAYVAVLGDFNDTPTPRRSRRCWPAPTCATSAPTPLRRRRPAGHLRHLTAANSIDYLLLSPALFAKATGGGIWRMGAWGGVNGTLWPHYDTPHQGHRRRLRPRRALRRPDPHVAAPATLRAASRHRPGIAGSPLDACCRPWRPTGPQRHAELTGAQPAGRAGNVAVAMTSSAAGRNRAKWSGSRDSRAATRTWCRAAVADVGEPEPVRIISRDAEWLAPLREAQEVVADRGGTARIVVHRRLGDGDVDGGGGHRANGCLDGSGDVQTRIGPYPSEQVGRRVGNPFDPGPLHDRVDVEPEHEPIVGVLDLPQRELTRAVLRERPRCVQVDGHCSVEEPQGLVRRGGELAVVDPSGGTERKARRCLTVHQWRQFWPGLEPTLVRPSPRSTPGPTRWTSAWARPARRPSRRRTPRSRASPRSPPAEPQVDRPQVHRSHLVAPSGPYRRSIRDLPVGARSWPQCAAAA